MKAAVFLSLVAVLVAGCETVPPGVERGPHGTIAYDVIVESSEPGVTILVNGEEVGTTPLTLRIWGDKDGTFHDFGSYVYVVQALPLNTNQFTQTRVFRTGRWFTPEDVIPRQIYFDMDQPPPAYVTPVTPPVYYYPYYPYSPPIYFHYHHVRPLHVHPRVHISRPPLEIHRSPPPRR
ncbi:MAG TPA: PEGA domain-containing protein [Verrucomicrobia bacterium]|nr:PEGA domain-containing protein [Verrucomicrobiota bacterium]HOB33652.1 PEGA domain-containing protein [Verrucomicrobiota bacterium]HOP96542.1 PEGA domain-containing protein [Verrucomicrobiota bacterium]